MNKERILSLLMFVALAASIFMGNMHVIDGIIEPWADDGTYSHGYLILAIMGFLYWRNRDSFGYLAEKINFPALIAFIGFYLVFSVGLITGIEVVYRSVIPFLLVSIFYIILAPKETYKLAFPTLFLIFAIPFWGLLNPPLQYIAAIVVSAMVEAWGVSAYLDGIYITIGAGTFEVAGGCSGLRYLLVILTLCSLFSHLYLNEKRSILKIFVIGIGLSFVTNWIRILILVLLGHYTDMQHEMIEDHNNLGWILFVVFLYPLYVYANKLADKELKEEISEQITQEDNLKVKGSVRAVVTSVIVAMTISIFTMEIYVKRDIESNALTINKAIDGLSGDWEKLSLKSPVSPEFIDGEGETVLIKNKHGHVLNLTLHRYDNKVGNKDITDWKNQIIPENWKVEDSHIETIKSEDITVDFEVLELEKRRTTMLMFKVNKVGDIYTTSNLETKLLKIKAFLDNKKFSGVIVASMECKRTCKPQREVIKSFLEVNMKTLDSAIR